MSDLDYLLRHFDRPRGTFRHWYGLAVCGPIPGYVLCEVQAYDRCCWIDSATACRVIETLRLAGAVGRVDWQPAPVQQLYGLAGMSPPGLTGQPLKADTHPTYHTAWRWRAVGPWPIEVLRRREWPWQVIH